MSSRNPRRIALFALAALLLFVVVLLKLPLADFVRALEGHDLARAVLSRKRLVFAIVGSFAIVVTGWLVFRRQFKILLACVIAGVLAALTYGVYEFQQTYPRADSSAWSAMATSSYLARQGRPALPLCSHGRPSF